jgi:hypothetical protein
MASATAAAKRSSSPSSAAALWGLSSARVIATSPGPEARTLNAQARELLAAGQPVISRWWQMAGSRAYPDAARLLICADAGGSNGYRSRLWKVELGKLAAETGLQVTVCHFPPGTSKWNRIEHRLFSQISMNWRGRPLVSDEVIVDPIGATTTRTGLRVHAELDLGAYPTGVKVGDAELAAVPLTRHDWHGEWNYTITGQRTRTTAAQFCLGPLPRCLAAQAPEDQRERDEDCRRCCVEHHSDDGLLQVRATSASGRQRDDGVARPHDAARTYGTRVAKVE